MVWKGITQPCQMLDAYFGVASDWTLDVEPAEDDEVRMWPPEK